ncbi:Ig-like domain-containing protein [Vibrio parahaemolyticus]|uniref:Ig-like domain-containing protein n=1 Tax=Vibrio parahaemolyticus TaxID=670 RepID=UPI00215BBB0D|nr:Ig-like domain-containing protein [Vibrio parahaemolyticus]MCS0063806.1 hypothetical protein [Vibrio parahaemolyticus]
MVNNDGTVTYTPDDNYVGNLDGWRIVHWIDCNRYFHLRRDIRRCVRIHHR